MHGFFRNLACACACACACARARACAFAFAAATLPCLAVAGPLGIPSLPGPLAVGGGLAKSAASAGTPVTDPLQMVGQWRAIGVDATDPASPITDTIEVWIGADGGMEMRMGASGFDLGSGERTAVRAQSRSRWESEAGSFIVTTGPCRIVSDPEGLDLDCSDPGPDSSTLSMYRIADIGGRRALIFLSDGSESAEADDTLYYAGAAPAFLVAPVLGPNSVRPQARAKVGGSRGLALRDGGFAALLPDGRMLDLRGRAWPARSR